MADGERLGYRPGLDGLRAFAVMGVVVAHSPYADDLPGMNVVGVDVFFVLSGFLITVLLLEEHERTGRIALRDFYVRRLRRLLPALALFVGVVTVVGLLTSAPWGRPSAAAAPYALTYTMNLAMTELDVRPDVLSHTWSLAVEEHFYLLWPLVLLACLRFGVPRRAICYGLGAAAGLSLWFQMQADDFLWLFGSHTRGGAILIGCLCAFAWKAGIRLSLPLATPLAALALWKVATINSYAPEFRDGWNALGWAASAVLVMAVVGRPSPLLGSRPLVYLGRISYGVYLWHLLIAQILRDVTPSMAAPVAVGLTVAASVAAADLSHRCVETRYTRSDAITRTHAISLIVRSA